jgi:NAD(P)-dependent dehydrogenase (short-subunit alcohol dehydrogenase family)
LLAIELHGRTSFVTGATRGIGRACAEALASAGSHVAIVDLDEGGAAKTAAEIAAKYGVTARGYGCDVSRPEAVQAIVDRAASELGGLDHVVNNAGIQYVAPIAEFPLEKYQQVRASISTACSTRRAPRGGTSSRADTAGSSTSRAFRD